MIRRVLIQTIFVATTMLFVGCASDDSGTVTEGGSGRATVPGASSGSEPNVNGAVTPTGPGASIGW